MYKWLNDLWVGIREDRVGSVVWLALLCPPRFIFFVFYAYILVGWQFSPEFESPLSFLRKILDTRVVTNLRPVVKCLQKKTENLIVHLLLWTCYWMTIKIRFTQLIFIFLLVAVVTLSCTHSPWIGKQRSPNIQYLSCNFWPYFQI